MALIKDEPKGTECAGKDKAVRERSTHATQHATQDSHLLEELPRSPAPSRHYPADIQWGNVFAGCCGAAEAILTIFQLPAHALRIGGHQAAILGGLMRCRYDFRRGWMVAQYGLVGAVPTAKA